MYSRNTWSRGGNWASSFVGSNRSYGATNRPVVLETTVAKATAAAPIEAPKVVAAQAQSTAKKYLPVAIAAGLAYLFLS